MTKHDLTVAMIKASTSVSIKTKIALDSLEPQYESVDSRLIPWAKEVFKEGRQLNHSDKQISTWVRDYARIKNYSEPAIAKTLRELTK
jgi:hypothetical protein